MRELQPADRALSHIHHARHAKSLDGKILDGWNRYRACLELGIESSFREWAGECGTPVEFVIARNLERHHYTEPERAFIATRLATLEQGRPRRSYHEDEKWWCENCHVGFPEQVWCCPVCRHHWLRMDQECKNCRSAGRSTRFRNDFLTAPVADQEGESEENQEDGKCAPVRNISQTEAADRLGVSRRSVQYARRIDERGVPELVHAVERGQIGLRNGARLAGLAPEVQQAALDTPDLVLRAQVDAPPTKAGTRSPGFGGAT